MKQSLSLRGQCLDGSRPSQREKCTGQSPPRPHRAPSLLLLRGDGRGRSSGVYRCPGRQLGVLRFALRETVPFSVFRLLSLRTRCSRYWISRASRAQLAPFSRASRRLGFSPKGPSLILSLWWTQCHLNLAYTWWWWSLQLEKNLFLFEKEGHTENRQMT